MSYYLLWQQVTTLSARCETNSQPLLALKDWFLILKMLGSPGWLQNYGKMCLFLKQQCSVCTWAWLCRKDAFDVAKQSKCFNTTEPWTGCFDNSTFLVKAISVLNWKDKNSIQHLMVGFIFFGTRICYWPFTPGLQHGQEFSISLFISDTALFLSLL